MRNVLLRKKFRILWIFLILSGLLIYLNREMILRAISDFLIVKDKLSPADVIHVIAGEDYRTNYGIELYKQGLGDVLFFTGGWCKIHQDYHGQRGQRISLEQGVPVTGVAFDDTSVMSTYDEALRLKDYITQNNLVVHSIIVVSDPHHMRRAEWAYHRIFGRKVKILMAPVPFENTREDDNGYICGYFEDVKSFFAAAASDNEAMLLYLN